MPDLCEPRVPVPALQMLARGNRISPSNSVNPSKGPPSEGHSREPLPHLYSSSHLAPHPHTRPRRGSAEPAAEAAQAPFSSAPATLAAPQPGHGKAPPPSGTDAQPSPPNTGSRPSSIVRLPPVHWPSRGRGSPPGSGPTSAEEALATGDGGSPTARADARLRMPSFEGGSEEPGEGDRPPQVNAQSGRGQAVAEAQELPPSGKARTISSAQYSWQVPHLHGRPSYDVSAKPASLKDPKASVGGGSKSFSELEGHSSSGKQTLLDVRTRRESVMAAREREAAEAACHDQLHGTSCFCLGPDNPLRRAVARVRCVRGTWHTARVCWWQRRQVQPRRLCPSASTQRMRGVCIL